MNNNTAYYWQIFAKDDHSNTTAGPVWKFTTVTGGTAPNAPTLSSPSNGSTNQSTSPTLSWNASTGASSYTLQVSTSNTFSSYVYNQSGLTNTSQQVSGLSNLTQYYWRVSATNSYGTSGWSTPTWSFTTTGTVPSVPILSSPSNGATNQSTSPTLSWNASTGASSYTLQVSTSNTFSSYVYNQSGLTNASQQVSGLSNLTQYYWRVSATNSYGTSSYSSTWNFTTIAGGTAPSVPTLLSPSNSSTNQSISPTLSWNSSSGAASYTLQVSTSNSFSSYVYNQSGLTNTSQQISGLNNSTNYYWRVNATNSYGTSGWSTPTWSFTTASGSSGGSSCVGTPTVTYAGKTYNTVQIGTQCWLKENLDVGSMINGNQNPSNNSTIEKYCYNNDVNNCSTYGGLYQWNEAMAYSTTPGTKGICPDGWHIPTLAEFQTLGTAVSNNGNALKAVGQGTGSGAGTNVSGFSALLAGYRNNNSNFNNLGNNTDFWSSTENNTNNAYNMNLNNNDSNINFNNNNKENGFSVRCLKDSKNNYCCSTF